MKRFTKAAFLAAGIALGAGSVRALAEDDGGGPGTEDGGGGGGTDPGSGTPTGTVGTVTLGTRTSRGGPHGRLDHDVRVKLTLGDRKSATPAARIHVKNQGRNAESGVAVELRAQSETGDLLGSWTMDLAPGAWGDIHVVATPPAGTTVLVATAALSGAVDQDPADNVSRVNIGATGAIADASVGAALFAAKCASCHGALAKGTSSGPWIRGVSAGTIWEAIHEGEDGMPTFPNFSSSDVRAIADYLKNPDAVQPPAPPVTPPSPPPGTPVTYKGRVKAILDASCSACHGGKTPSAGIRLDTYAGASANAARALAAVQAGRMPLGGTPLPAADIQAIQDWISGGMKQ
jgi:mono/diheme cytochrome c family protein